MAHVLLPSTIEDPNIWKTYFKNEESDEIVYHAIQALRKQVEEISQWKYLKQQAASEIREVPDTILQILLHTCSPFIKELPAGHGPGHLSRDLIHLTAILQDPDVQTCDAVELLVGILAGTFHDIGNAVINRYEESIRFSGHAEVGAFLFGHITKNILPPHLSLLIQFAIASHTNYIYEFSVTKGKGTLQEKTLIRRPYVSTMIIDDDGIHKRSLWITQATDRLDALGLPMITRHSITKVLPTLDFSQGAFHVVHPDEEKDFLDQFAPIVRTQEYKNVQKNLSDKTTNILEHLYTFYETAVEKSVYSRNDTTYFTSHLVSPLAFDQARFIIAVLAQQKILSGEERKSTFEKFCSLVHVIEPASDTDYMTGLFRKKMQLLTEESQSHWVNGYSMLTNVLYPRWYEETRASIVQAAHIADKKIQAISVDLHRRANMIIEAYNPLHTMTQPLENLLRLLL